MQNGIKCNKTSIKCNKNSTKGHKNENINTILGLPGKKLTLATILRTNTKVSVTKIFKKTLDYISGLVMN